MLVIVPEGADASLLAATRASLAIGELPAAEVFELGADEPLAAGLGRITREHARRDVACVTAGAQLPLAWDLRLAKAAYASPEIAAAVPLCDASALHALVPEDRRVAVAGRAEIVDRSAYCMGTRSYYETPALHPICAYLRADALGEGVDAIAGIDDVPLALNLLANRWRALGRQVVMCDFIYVGFEGEALERAPGIDPVEASAFGLHSPLGGLRRRVAEAIDVGLPPVSAPALDARPVQLHVMHFWGGGLDKWVRDFGRADTTRTNLILATYRIGERGGQRVVLYSDPDAKVPIHTWDIARPIRATAVSSLEYRGILEQVVREYGVEAIIVSSLIGHSLDALRTPLPTLVVAHDFYPLCQSINPRFDAGETLDVWGPGNPHYDVLGRPSDEDWRALRDAYVATLVNRRIEMVVPTASVAQTLARLEPRLATYPMRVIGHGIDFAVDKLSLAKVESGKPLRLVVLGRMAQNKGEALLREAAPGLRGIAEVTLVGCGPHAPEWARPLGWKTIERYGPEELPAILGKIAPHAAVLASIVPETFSYTLSELWALGIPPLATALGSFGERIHDGMDGFLFEPRAMALVELVRSLHADSAKLGRVALRVAQMASTRTARAMVADYHSVLPLEPRPMARFEVGVGTETALTEPYRHLQQAYAHLQGAYDDLSGAYGKTNEAYAHAKAEFERVSAELAALRALCQEYGEQLETLNLKRRWWRAPEAQRLVEEMRAKLEPAANKIST
ncbi:MAG TPA: glycosyltransferase [Usitatibacter sp.]|nr:glycosyltransferase [Usitatibacter sp.]